jgi:HEAT repeat protein
LEVTDDTSVRHAVQVPYLLGPRIINAIKNEIARDRWCAAEALGEIGDKTAIPALKNALKDDDDDVRNMAAKALKKLEVK